MELQDFLHMNEGDGELSYSQNSFVQKGVNLMSKPILESGIQALISEFGSLSKELNVADLGCGVGPVPLAFVSLVIENVIKNCKELKWNNDDEFPEIAVYFNDLPSNDFSLLFKDLLNLEVIKRKDGVPLCFLMSAPGSYHGRLFPRNTLHFVHANYALHWLSQAPSELHSVEGVPMNKGNIYISESSPKVVAEVYLAQFQQDFTRFLVCRSKEILSKGRMLLTFRGRPSSSNATTWQPWELKTLAKTINCLVSKGLIKDEKLDNFNFPYYGPSKEDIQSIVKNEGSFEMESVSTMAHHVAHEMKDNWERAMFIGKFMRSFSEPLIKQHFGDEVLDSLYQKFIHLIFEYLANGGLAEHYTIVVLLKKI